MNNTYVYILHELFDDVAEASYFASLRAAKRAKDVVGWRRSDNMPHTWWGKANGTTWFILRERVKT